MILYLKKRNYIRAKGADYKCIYNYSLKTFVMWALIQRGFRRNLGLRIVR